MEVEGGVGWFLQSSLITTYRGIYVQYICYFILCGAWFVMVLGEEFEERLDL
jgi:hypothetical protein